MQFNISHHTSTAGIWIFMFRVFDLKSNKSWKLRPPLRTRGLVHMNVKQWSSFTHHHTTPNPYDFMCKRHWQEGKEISANIDLTTSLLLTLRCGMTAHGCLWWSFTADGLVCVHCLGVNVNILILICVCDSVKGRTSCGFGTTRVYVNNDRIGWIIPLYLQNVGHQLIFTYKTDIFSIYTSGPTVSVHRGPTFPPTFSQSMARDEIH